LDVTTNNFKTCDNALYSALRRDSNRTSVKTEVFRNSANLLSYVLGVTLFLVVVVVAATVEAAAAVTLHSLLQVRPPAGHGMYQIT
jgi:hypothetical protein